MIKKSLILITIITGNIIGQMQAQNKILEVIVTSDVHGAIMPIDVISGGAVPSLAHISAYVNMERERHDREVLLFDNGDYLQGDPYVYYYDYIDRKDTHIGARAFNYMRYDAGCVGNHDFEAGHEVYDAFKKELDMPWLAANVIDKKTGKCYFAPYITFKRCGKKIAVLGLTTPGTPSWLPEKIISGLEFEDMVESARYWMEIIQEREKPDFIIGLFHAGTDYKFNEQTADTFKNENATLLVAQRVPGFDLIFAGHDHKGHDIKLTNDFGQEVIIAAPTSRSRDFCSIEIEFLSSGEQKITPHLYMSTSLAPDEKFIAKFKKDIVKVNAYFDESIGFFMDSIKASTGIFEDDPLTNMLHQVQLDVTGADISLLAPMSTTSVIKAGKQYRKDLFKLYRFDNSLYTMEFTGEEIRNILEFSYWQWFNMMSDSSDYLLRYKLKNGELSSRLFPETYTPTYNYESAEGIIYTVDATKPKGERIKIISMNDGTGFDLSKTYHVAVNSYRGTGGGSHLTIGADISPEDLHKRIISASDYDMKYYIEQWITEHSPISPNKSVNWTVIPEEYFKAGFKRESRLFMLH
ncbi:MAG: bifunctional UDP-sugar hydrolase/5'-nucleotidase [Bacteroidales bacterium]|nr:bifunctional UDP-sugar hydrolase/5'-nucleotidase [Bacteroidales bacterium]